MERSRDIISSPKFMALTPDQQLSLRGYLIKKMDNADRKHLLFATLSNVALAIGGSAPVLAILATDPTSQKILNAVSSIAVLGLGILSLEKYTIEHRRAGYLLDSLLQEWISGVGEFDGDAGEDFRLLVRKAKEILDTGETSFIGAGTHTPENPLPAPPPLMPLPKSTAPDPIAGIPLDEFIDWGAIGDVVTQETAKVDPQDFAQWQATALKEKN